ncbi:hypothetical protein GCM10022395_25070 [Snuella lapsa]|uniref:Uncharacterized protein n=1 Tax=Snuella lapsa TaxID=870481 RepID=A0ABP6XZA1_9FLAO
MLVDKDEIAPQSNKLNNIYLSIDHLKPGKYTFNIMLDNKIVKSFKLKK